MQSDPAAEQNNNIKWCENLWNQSGRKGKGLWRKGTVKDHAILQSLWSTTTVPG